MTGRDRTASVAGLLAVAAFVAGQYVAPALVWPEEQVGGVQRTFYASFEGRLLAQAVLFGLAAGLFLVLLGGLRAAVVVAAGAVAAGLVLLQAATLVALVALRGSELDVQAQGSAWAARALFELQGAVGNLGALAVGSVAGLDAGAAEQVVFLLVSAWVAALAWSVGWPWPSAAGRTAPAPGRPG